MSAAFLDGDPDDRPAGAGGDTPPSDAPPKDRVVGSLAEEMALLAAALDATRPPPGEGGTSRGGGGRDQPCPTCGTAQTPACTWCPVCRGVGIVRAVGPETLRSLADVAGLVSEGLRRVATWLAEEAPAHGDHGSSGGYGPQARPWGDGERQPPPTTDREDARRPRDEGPAR